MGSWLIADAPLSQLERYCSRCISKGMKYAVSWRMKEISGGHSREGNTHHLSSELVEPGVNLLAYSRSDNFDLESEDIAGGDVPMHPVGTIE